MRIAYIADLHVGNHRLHGGPIECGLNDRCRETLDVIKAAMDRCLTEQVDIMVILGDVFDTARPSPQMIRAFHDACGGIYTLILAGNHDRNSDQEGDHALGPLDYAPNIRVIERPMAIRFTDEPGALAMLPFRAEPVMEWFTEDLEAVETETQGEPIVGVCTHFGLHDQTLRARHFWAEGSHDAVDVDDVSRVMAAFNIPYLLAGNWHTAKQWEGPQSCIQVGALVPTGFDNPGVTGYGGMVIQDVGAGTVEMLSLPGPRFIKVTAASEVNALVSTFEHEPRYRIYISWSVMPDDYDAALQLRASLPDHFVCDVTISRKYAEQRAVQAANAARAQDTIEDALEGYVKTYPFPDTIDVNSVLARCRSFLKL